MASVRTVTWPDERRRFATLAAFAAIAWLGMLVHNVVDLPTLTLLSTENSLPAVASAILVGT